LKALTNDFEKSIKLEKRGLFSRGEGKRDSKYIKGQHKKYVSEGKTTTGGKGSGGKEKLRGKGSLAKGESLFLPL